LIGNKAGPYLFKSLGKRVTPALQIRVQRKKGFAFGVWFAIICGTFALIWKALRLADADVLELHAKMEAPGVFPWRRQDVRVHGLSFSFGGLCGPERTL
ncbi:MAG: hypothetical protein ACI4QJ_07415, partial [Candidatus Spyradenecus sp.]